MKRYLLYFSLFIFALSACKKAATDPFNAPAQAANEEALIQAYLKANPTITVTKDPSGLYYQITDPGTGAHPTANSNITVSFTATGLDSTAYKKESSIYFALNGLTQAWRTVIPKIGVGGSVFMIVPSALGHGNANYDTIPASTVVIYKISLQGFN